MVNPHIFMASIVTHRICRAKAHEAHSQDEKFHVFFLCLDKKKKKKKEFYPENHTVNYNKKHTF